MAKGKAKEEAAATEVQAPEVEEKPVEKPKKAPTLTVDRKIFAKLVYDLTQGYAQYWTGVHGRARLCEMAGAKSAGDVEEMYAELKQEYVGGGK